MDEINYPSYEDLLAIQQEEQNRLKQQEVDTLKSNVLPVQTKPQSIPSSILKLAKKNQELNEKIEFEKNLMVPTAINLNKNKSEQILPPLDSLNTQDSLMSPVAVVDESKTPPSISSVSKQQASVAPKLASSAVDKDVQALVQKQQSPSQYYQNLMDQYNQIQKFGQDKQLMGRLGEAGEDLAYALARAKKPESSFYKDFAKSGETDIEQFKQKSEFEKKARLEDPTSKESEAARNLLKEQGITVPNTVSAAFIEKNYPQFANIISKKERAEERAFDKEQKKQEKLGSWIQDARRFATTGDIGKIRGRLVKAKNGIDMFENYSKGGSTGAKDLAGFFSYMKGVQQDDSVIRESEARLGLSLGSLPARLKGRLAAFFRGEMFSKEQRQQMLEVLKIQANQLETEYTNELKPLYNDLKVQPGMTNKDAKTEFKRITNLNLNFDGDDDSENNSKESEVSSKTKNPNYHGQTVIQNGKTFKWNEDKQRYDKI